MSAPLYDEIHCLTLNLLRAAEGNDRKGEAKAFQALKVLCADNADTEADHPLQWEALGDFSNNVEQAITAYETGLACAERAGLDEYIASLNFALAEVFAEQQDLARALKHAQQASELSEQLDDSKFAEAVSELVAQLEQATTEQ